MRKIMSLAVLTSLALGGVSSAQDWEAQASGTTELLNGVWFVDAVRGFAVGNGGTILETEDAGQTWTPLLLTVDDMLDVAFLDGSIGLIVGDNGKIFRTVNAGQDWVEVPSVTENNLAGVAFGAGGMAYAAGRDGTILRSTDGGASWNLVETGADRYRAVTAHGSRAWVVGNDGAMRATDDGGATWFSLASGTSDDLHDVIFIGNDEGWVAGQSNTVMYTDDGGATWSPRNTSIGVGLNTVFFGNPDLGWVAGSLGNAYGSTDGALTWDNEPTPTMQPLNAIHFVDAFNGWAAGEGGVILRRHVPSVELSLDRDKIEWDTVPGDPAYSLLRGDLGNLRTTGGDFASATEECLGQTNATFLEYAPAPTSGGEGFWFLVRVDPGSEIGTWDSGSFRQAGLRDGEIAASGVDCMSASRTDTVPETRHLRFAPTRDARFSGLMARRDTGPLRIRVFPYIDPGKHGFSGT